MLTIEQIEQYSEMHEKTGYLPSKIIRELLDAKDSHKIICITEGTGQSVEVIGNIHERVTE